MYKKQGSDFFLNFATRKLMVKYFNILQNRRRKLFIPILNDGKQNHYYFEQYKKDSTAILRIFLDIEDMKEYITRECDGSKLSPIDFNVLEADMDSAYESSIEIAAAGQDLKGSLKCIVCTYVNKKLVEFDVFWSNKEIYFN